MFFYWIPLWLYYIYKELNRETAFRNSAPRHKDVHCLHHFLAFWLCSDIYFRHSPQAVCKRWEGLHICEVYLIRSADECFKDETRLLLLWNGSLVTLYTFYPYLICDVKQVHILMVKSRVSKSCLMAELCFHRFVQLGCIPIYIFGFNHKQCASD